MTKNLPIALYPTSVILDNVIANILLAESPIDARLTAQNGASFHLSCASEYFSLEYLEQIIFKYIIEHHKDIALLEQLCGMEDNLSILKKINYIPLYFSIDEYVETEFLFRATTHKEQTRRYKLLAALDSLISIGNLIILQNSVPETILRSSIDNTRIKNPSQSIFFNTAMLMRNLGIIYSLDKFKNPLMFSSPIKGIGLRPEKQEHSRNFDRYRSQFTEYMQEALKKREEVLNATYFELINNLFQKVKQSNKQICSLGGQNKAYKKNLLKAMNKFMNKCSCPNLALFKKYFFEAHTENSPLYSDKQNSFYISSEDMLFYRCYTDYSNKERNDVVPDSTLEELFKELTVDPKKQKNKRQK